MNTERLALVMFFGVIALITVCITIVQLMADPVSRQISSCRQLVDTQSEQVCLGRIGLKP